MKNSLKLFCEENSNIQEIADACTKVIRLQFSYFVEDSEPQASKKVDYEKLRKAVADNNIDAIDEQVTRAMSRCFGKIEVALEELLSPKMENSVGGSHVLAMLSIICTMMLKSQNISSLRKDLEDEKVLAKSDAEAYKGLVLGMLSTIYDLAIGKTCNDTGTGTSPSHIH